ncbi:MAG: hypothetical protein ACP5KB_01795 [Thermoprotei archaeon]
MSFVEAYPKKSDGLLVWFPVAIAEFGGCSPSIGRLVLECCLSEVLGNPLVRFLTIRRLNKNTRILSYPSINAVKLAHSRCSEYELFKDVEITEEILSDVEKARKYFSDLISSEAAEQKVRRRWWSLELFRPPRIDTQGILLKSNIAIIKEILKNLCLDKRVKPSYWTPGYLLMRVNQESSQVSVIERDKEEISKIYSRLLTSEKVAGILKSQNL